MKSVIRQSERIYSLILSFYPKKYRQEYGEEMKYVFSESLKDAYTESGETGVISFWTRAIVDAGKSLVIQNLDNWKGGDTLKTKSNDIIRQNKAFGWLAAVTAVVLSVPLLGRWPWSMSDFVIIAVLVFGIGSLFIFTARKITKTSHRIAVGAAFLFALMWIWAELAVGVFTNWGS